MDLNLFVDAYKSDIEMATNEAKNDLGHNSLFLVALNNVLKEYDSILENLEVEDGTSLSTAQEFVDKIESEYQSSVQNEENWGWRTVYAFSVHLKGSVDPAADNQDGQWVNAQFETSDATYIEWYHIVEGKLKTWYQAKGDFTFSK
jgi:hypothetical protein